MSKSNKDVFNARTESTQVTGLVGTRTLVSRYAIRSAHAAPRTRPTAVDSGTITAPNPTYRTAPSHGEHRLSERAHHPFDESGIQNR